MGIRLKISSVADTGLEEISEDHAYVKYGFDVPSYMFPMFPLDLCKRYV